MLRKWRLKATVRRRKERERYVLSSLTLTFNSTASFSKEKVDFTKAGSKLILPKKPDKAAKNPEIMALVTPRQFPIHLHTKNCFSIFSETFVYFDSDSVTRQTLSGKTPDLQVQSGVTRYGWLDDALAMKHIDGFYVETFNKCLPLH